MYKIKTLFHLSIIFMALATLPQVAYSYKEHAVAGHAESNVSKLEKIDKKIGTGEEAVVGKTVNVHYTGWLYDEAAPDNKGKKFDSSYDRDNYFSFLLGSGRVIKGWDQGVAGMKVGGRRTLIIPPSMAYGAQGAGNVIPPNATLIFDVELMGLQ
ncbi:FKBP-type peptidyl-prolyl cis-trans isomerase FkpA [Nitrosomonas cryotolerans]|uniref:Peptidyl-prolyl cis-trans isomerase n=1 Tax=Nitrosomonas cryotolerans ATCC 49181 TaxID=1131553 RepID=A0A1N6GQI1_9PROT|nr:FKBP-type peptidyl-prolyl cis-trans isomerase [Nitrosomonas cryotolerans]SFP39655.1 FKBP-type peptidyl-prolyl cis-trans isomerase FkpA [Nitrosomonas cryotolerans]SIO09695.1 FKBP-type peptidyl-prolyl cis-trans isomerase FkpA [Nitrosomonas cryotolerans ATCC 49181]